MKLKNVILVIAIGVLFSCSSTNENSHIEIVFFKYNVLKGPVSPDWNEFIEGRYPEYQAKCSITDKISIDSIILLVKKLKPINSEIIPQFSYPFMQCSYRSPDSSVVILILRNDYLTLNGQNMKLDMKLVDILKRKSGYNNPPTFNPQ